MLALIGLGSRVTDIKKDLDWDLRQKNLIGTPLLKGKFAFNCQGHNTGYEPLSTNLDSEAFHTR